MSAAAESALATDRDPVCGMKVDPAHPRGGTHTHAGKTYGFCSPRCRERFAADPERYLVPERARAGSQEQAGQSGSRQGAAGTWTCPMHPEVQSDRPGACPKCGMALEPRAPAVAKKVEWTCPMHPQIVRDGPGTCPICGMALEPRTISLDEPDNPELRDMQRRLLVSVPFTAALLVIAMGEMFGWHFPPWIGSLELLLATPVVLWAGAPFF